MKRSRKTETQHLKSSAYNSLLGDPKITEAVEIFILLLLSRLFLPFLGQFYAKIISWYLYPYTKFPC